MRSHHEEVDKVCGMYIINHDYVFSACLFEAFNTTTMFQRKWAITHGSTHTHRHTAIHECSDAILVSAYRNLKNPSDKLCNNELNRQVLQNYGALG